MILQLLDENRNPLTSKAVHGETQPATDWTEVSCILNIDVKYPAKYLEITIRGKDNRFWAGNYGAKFSRISITVQCLDRKV